MYSAKGATESWPKPSAKQVGEVTCRENARLSELVGELRPDSADVSVLRRSRRRRLTGR